MLSILKRESLKSFPSADPLIVLNWARNSNGFLLLVKISLFRSVVSLDWVSWIVFAALSFSLEVAVQLIRKIGFDKVSNRALFWKNSGPFTLNVQISFENK